jgi:hypothetical protein
MLNIFKPHLKICYEVRITEIKNGVKNEDRRFYKKKKIALTLFLATEKRIMQEYPDAKVITTEANDYNEIDNNSFCYLIQKAEYTCIRHKDILSDTKIIEIFECHII